MSDALSPPRQERAADYPRPPRLEPSARRIRIHFASETIADTALAWSADPAEPPTPVAPGTVRAWRVLETFHPPTWYLPRAAFRPGVLHSDDGGSVCEWKGRARYWTLAWVGPEGRRSVLRGAWSYPDPTPAFAPIAGYVAVYAGRVEACFVDEERVTPQPGDFYGGWITSDVVGPFKGGPGTQGW